MPTLTRDTLADSLRRLTSDGGAENRLVVSAGAYYLIFHGRAGSPEITIEAATNFYLQGADALTPARARVLGERGFAERSGRNNAYREVRAADGEALGRVADDALRIFAAAYGAPEGAAVELELQLGDPDPTANPELMRAMRALAVQRDMEARQRVYVAVMKGSFLVPGAPGEPRVVDRLSGLPVFAAFTDAASLRLWEPRGCPAEHVPGGVLVPLAVERGVGSLLINPRGNVGGELYINELRAIAEALARRRS